MKRSSLWVGGAIAGTWLAACGSSGGSPAAPPPAAAPPLVGCAADRPAIAHHGGALPIEPAPAYAPTPCSASTDLAAWDTTMVITETNEILFAPAAAPGLARSGDNGMTWAALSPPSPPPGSLYHPWLWRDPASRRVFYNLFGDGGSCTDGTGATLWFSDDEGTTWQKQPVGCGSMDWGKVITGPAASPARKAALAASGYPSVVYYSATGPALIIGPDHMFFRSLDGGKTFTRTATDPDDTVGYPTAGAVAPDGTVYVPMGSPAGLALAVSKDEGDTWTDVVVPGSSFNGSLTHETNFLSMNVTADSAGTVYVTWSDDRNLLPYLAFSRDGGGTWSTPVMIGAPGVYITAFPSLTVKTPGYVAVAYYGSTQAMAPSNGDGYSVSDGRAYNAYLTVTTNLFADEPVFWSATFNDPAAPVFTGRDFQVSEYAGYPVFAGDGSIWTAFLDGPNGMAARLTPPPND
jgi:hypothetical protein